MSEAKNEFPECYQCTSELWFWYRVHRYNPQFASAIFLELLAEIDATHSRQDRLLLGKNVLMFLANPNIKI